MLNATFTKLRNGEWGLRVKGDARTGDTVRVTKRDGRSFPLTVGRIVWQGKGVTLCEKQAAEKPESDRQFVERKQAEIESASDAGIADAWQATMPGEDFWG